MSSTRHVARACLVATTWVALIIAAPPTVTAQGQPVKQQSSQVTRGEVAEQLGARLGSGQNDEFALGSSITATLTNPAKLAKLGITGMHEGARVTAMRVAPDKLRVEVDEIEPAQQMKKATFKLDERGRLSSAAP